MTVTKLGRLQLKIVRVLWEKGRANAREITDALNQAERVAHSTVQTLLRTLEEKNAVDHDVDGRTFVFYPLVAEEEIKRSATRELVDRLFGGDVGHLMTYLLDNEKVSRKELTRIRRLIDKSTSE